jgi:hypothetical protein
MSAPLTYANAFDYLLGLGRRFSLIGRAELTFTGEAVAAEGYPLLLVEGDPQGSELIDAGRPVGSDSFTIAVQVLLQQADPNAADLAHMLQQANAWADSLTEQLRYERPQQLWGVNKLALPGQAGSDLACGYRVELTLKLVKEIDRTTNRDLFATEV